MIVNDTERQNKISFYNRIEAKQGESQAKIDELKNHEKFAAQKTNPVSNWGRPHKTEIFEKMLGKLNNKFTFEEFDQKDLYHQITNNGWPVTEPWHHKQLFITSKNKETLEDEKVRVCIYPRHVLPEWSVMWQKDEALPNPEFISNPFKPATPMDFGDFNPEKEEVDWNKIPKNSPLYKYFSVTNGIAIRGWREILLICLREGFITLSEVETTFGPANSAEWSIKIYGKEHDGRPW